MKLDSDIDRVLTALGKIPPPAGMENRIAQRLTRAKAAHASSPSLIAGFLGAGTTSHTLQARRALYGISALATAALIISFCFQHKYPATNATARPVQILTSARPIPRSTTPAERALFRQPPVPSNRQPQLIRDELTGSDLLALEETRAPRLIAPLLPLTQQERLLRRATHSGELAQLAQLEPAREAELRSALLARQREQIDRYIERMLAPLAAAEVLSPTPPADPPADPPAVPAEPEPEAQ